MTRKVPPADWDRHAQEVARGIATLDRSKIPVAQFTAIIHEAIVDAMMLVADETQRRPVVREVRASADGIALSCVSLSVDETIMLRGIVERIRALDEAKGPLTRVEVGR